MTFHVWWRRDGANDRAPSAVFLDEDYMWAGEVDAASPKDLANKISTMNASESPLMNHRAPRTGDVITRKAAHGVWAYILTSLGIWALVDAYGGEDYTKSLDT